MKSVPKLIRRFVGIMLLSSLLLIILNFALLGIYTLNQVPNGSPWITSQEVADHLSKNENGYVLSENTALELQNTDVWAIFIDNKTMKVVWQTENLPETVPLQEKQKTDLLYAAIQKTAFGNICGRVGIII